MTCDKRQTALVLRAPSGALVPRFPEAARGRLPLAILFRAFGASLVWRKSTRDVINIVHVRRVTNQGTAQSRCQRNVSRVATSQLPFVLVGRFPLLHRHLDAGGSAGLAGPAIVVLEVVDGR